MADRPRLLERYARWWFDDLPPMHGALRFVFYAGLLGLAFLHEHSPLRAIELYRTVDPGLYEASGVLGLVGVPYLPPMVLEILALVATVTMVAAALGVLARLSQILAAVSFALLHGLTHELTGQNDAWFLPVYTLILLCFATTTDRFGVDNLVRALLKKRRQKQQLENEFSEFGDFASGVQDAGADGEVASAAEEQRKKTREIQALRRIEAAKQMLEEISDRPGTIGTSGFTRKAALVTTVALFFASGLAKLIDGGLAWVDGVTLRYHLYQERNWMADVIEDQLWLCNGLALLLVVLQLAGISTLLTRTTRGIFLAFWLASGVFSYLVLGIWDWATTWCLVLLVEWRSVAWKLHNFCLLGWRLWTAQHAEDVLDTLRMRIQWQFIRRWEIKTGAATPTCLPGGFRSRQQLTVMAIGTALMAAAVLVPVLRVHSWPITSWDQLSAYDGERYRAGYREARYQDTEDVQSIAQDVLMGTASRHTALYLAGEYARVRLVGENKRRPKELRGGIGTTPEHWVRILAPVVVNDLATKPAAAIEQNPEFENLPSNQFLRRLVPVIRRRLADWEEFDRAELVFEMRGESIVLGSEPLQAATDAPPEDE